MTKTKRIASIAVSAMLAMSMMATSAVMPGSAANGYEITISSTESDHTYYAYQIFDSTTAVTGMDWGNGISDGSALITALQADGTVGSYFASCTSAYDVAYVLGTNTFTTAEMQAFAAVVSVNVNTANRTTSTYASGTYTLDVPSAGYYLVVEDNTASIASGEAYSAYIINTSNATALTPKTDAPSVDKQIYHNETRTWGSVGDNQIGDDVQFKITVDFPDVSDYDNYTLTVRDSLESYFSLNATSISDFNITYYDSSDQPVAVSSYNPRLTIGDDPTGTPSYPETFYMQFDLKNSELANVSYVTIEYSAELLSTAQVSSSTPGVHQDNTVYLTYSNDPTYTGIGTYEGGETPKVTVYEYTFTFDFNKVDSSGAALAGATFQLYDSTGALISFVKSTDGDTDVYTVVDSTATSSINYITTNTAGLYKIVGLDDAETYTLKETDAPAGYNLAGDTEFSITAAYNTYGTELTSLTGDATGTNTTHTANSLSATITNTSGTVLPTTGSFGTKLFYIGGGVLVAAAGVILVTRKRMSRKAD
ncbi:MAG: LPXTG cell wall anchor domain-containing protein [Ruminococcus sp.]|nr:LPXTG cell wall anchor domain-containing protein [Ruminococcus sp.]